MKKEKTYNEAVDGDEGFVPGEGYPSCDGEPCANVSDDSQDGTDTMADAAEGGDKAGAGSDLTAALAEWQDKFIRLQAEFDNYRKRTLKEKMDLVQTGGRDVLLAMLPVRDDVQRAVDAMQKSDDIEALRAGVMLISQKFTDTLRHKGVTEIDDKGKEIAAALYLSEGTVKQYINQLYAKLDMGGDPRTRRARLAEWYQKNAPRN